MQAAGDRSVRNEEVSLAEHILAPEARVSRSVTRC